MKQFPARCTILSIAGGRWLDAQAARPGLPGEIDDGQTTWVYRYDTLEVWGALALVVILSGAAWRLARR